MSVSAEPENPPRSSMRVSSPLERVEKMIPPFNETSFWLIVNAFLFIYIGLFQLVNGNGPVLFMVGGQYLSAGGVVLGIVYLLLWMWQRGHRKMAVRLIIVLSGLAVLGDLIFVAWASFGSFSGDSAILDIVGLLLFRAATREQSPA